MTNIFARKPGHYPPPARRYEQFISVFEKRVAEIQRQVTLMQSMERIYGVVRDAMEAADIKNDCKIELGATSVTISIVAAASDRLSSIDNLIAKVGRSLREAGLHESGDGTIRRGGYWYDIDATWAIKGGDVVRSVAMKIEIPRSGLADVEVVSETKTTTMDMTTYSFRQRPERIDQSTISAGRTFA